MLTNATEDFEQVAEDVTQANEKIDEVVPQECIQCTVEQRVVVLRISSHED